MGMGMGSSKSSKSKRNNGVWCVLLMGLLLAAAAEGQDCEDNCSYLSLFPKEYLRCIKYCRGGGHMRLEHFSGGAQVEEPRGASRLQRAGAIVSATSTHHEGEAAPIKLAKPEPAVGWELLKVIKLYLGLEPEKERKQLEDEHEDACRECALAMDPYIYETCMFVNHCWWY